mgnify:CR=1 FL=1
MSSTVLTHGNISIVKPARAWPLQEDHAPQTFQAEKGVITLPIGSEMQQITADGVEAFVAKRTNGRHQVIVLLVQGTATFSGGGHKAIKLDAGEYYISLGDSKAAPE